MNTAIRVRDIPRFPLTPEQALDMRIRAAMELDLYATLVRSYGWKHAWDRYIDLGGTLRFDHHGAAWLLAEVT